MHHNSELLFEKYALKYFQSGARVIEIGPDNFPSAYQIISRGRNLIWDTLDIIENEHLTYSIKDEYEFPIPANSYDIVFSANVIEHVRKIWLWVKELSRICTPGGYVITINPVSWPFHEAPIDCWRIYPDGMKVLYEEANLELIESYFESLEIPNYSRYIPGRSPEWQVLKSENIELNQSVTRNPHLERILRSIGFGWRRRKYINWNIKSKIIHMIGGSIERAYDTITIGRK